LFVPIRKIDEAAGRAGFRNSLPRSVLAILTGILLVAATNAEPLEIPAGPLPDVDGVPGAGEWKEAAVARQADGYRARFRLARGRILCLAVEADRGYAGERIDLHVADPRGENYAVHTFHPACGVPAATVPAAFRKLIDEYPESTLLPNAWYQLGKGREYSGDLESAISLYDKVVQQYSTSDAALLALIDMAELRLFQEDYQTAGADFNLFIQRFSGSERLNQARYGSGRAALALGDTAEAKEQFRFVVDSVAPNDGADLYVDRSRLALAEILWTEGNPDEALEQLATVASRRRDYTAAEALLMRGKILIDVNDLSAALAELRRLTTEFEDYPEYVEDGLMTLGGLYEKLTDSRAAIETYERLIEITEDKDVKKEAERRINTVRRGG